MAVTARSVAGRSRRAFLLAMVVAGLCVSAKPVGEDHWRSTLTYLSSALANRNPSDAMTVFSKSYPDRDLLSQYFAALTDSFDISSQIEVTDDRTSATKADVRATWTMTLQNPGSGETQRRSKNVEIHFAREAGKPWKIVGFDGIELFGGGR